MTEILLEGCRTEPLSHYLKALGVLRLVAEQADPSARGAWRRDGFVIDTTLSQAELIAFFLERYRPTPIITPWNKDGGFLTKVNRKAIDTICASTDPRLAAYRAVIRQAKEVLARSENWDKAELLTTLRSELDDTFLDWMDAALSLGSDKPRFPPLLGTGGGDGRLDFANNFMQRLAEAVFPEERGADTQGWLRSALFNTANRQMTTNAIGQFNPAGAGGANASSAAFKRDALVNPWDYLLMMEGALAFASAASRRMESDRTGGMAFPFSVRASGAGYSSSSSTDEDTSNTRDELWLPEWATLSTWTELVALFREGRATVGSRPVRTGVDFARSFSTLGVNRGIQAFHRYGFLVRNGLAYQAVPLGRWEVKASESVQLIGVALDRWLDALRRAGRDSGAPASWTRHARAIDERIFELIRQDGPGQVQALLATLAQAERAVVRNPRKALDKRLAPVPWLEARWLQAADDGTTEFRIAAALASAGLRHRLVPLDTSKRQLTWRPQMDGSAQVVWREGPLVPNLLDLLRREAISHPAPGGSHPWRQGSPRRTLRLADVSAFIAGDVSDARIEELLLALALIDPRKMPHAHPHAFGAHKPPVAWSLCALAQQPELPRVPGMITRLAEGDAEAATRLALRRLHASGLRPLLGMGRGASTSGLHEPPALSRRLGAALALPLSQKSLEAVRQDLLTPSEDHKE